MLESIIEIMVLVGRIILGVGFTYVVSSLVIYALTCRLLKARADDALTLFICTAGAGPLVIALMLWALYVFFPHMPGYFYMLAVVLLFGVLAWLAGSPGRDAVSRLKQTVSEKISRFDYRNHFFPSLLTAGMVIILLIQLISSIATPIISIDESQYSLVSSLIYERGTLDFYPLRDYDPQTGFFDLSDHPPAFYLLKVWSYHWQGTSSVAGLAKLVEPFYLICLALALWYVLLPFGLFAAGIGVFLLTLLPGLASGVMLHSIDLLRMWPFFVSFVWLNDCLARPERRNLLFGGFLIGLSMFCHTLNGLITLPFFGLLYLLGSRQPLLKRVSDLLWVSAVAVLTGGASYIGNLITMGSATGAALPLFDRLKSIDYYNVRMLNQGMESYGDLLVKGVFQQFTDLGFFGVSAWLGLGFSVLFFRRFIKNQMAIIAASVAALFMLVMLIATFSPQSRMIILALNARYPLMTQPFLIYLATLGLQAVGGIIAALWLRMGVAQWLGQKCLQLVQFCLRLCQAKPLLPYQAVTVLILLVMAGMWQEKLGKDWRHKHFFFIDNKLGKLAMVDGRFTSLDYIKTHIPPGKVFLADRDALFSYRLQQHKVIGSIYPKLIPVYQANTVTEAYQQIQKLGVDYILMHTGTWPNVVSDTRFYQLLANPQLLNVEFQTPISTLYRVLPTPRKTHLTPLASWNQAPQSIQSPFIWNIPAVSCELREPLPPRGLPRTFCNYRVSGQLKGPGRFDVQIKYLNHRNFPEKLYLWDSTSHQTNRPFQQQFKVPAGSTLLSVEVVQRFGSQPIQLQELALHRIHLTEPNQPEKEHYAATKP